MTRLCTAMFLALVLLPNQLARAVSLFNGQDLEGWDSYLGVPEVPALPFTLGWDQGTPLGLNNDPEQVFSITRVDGEAAIRVSGTTWGALTTRESFANYHLRLEFKWGEARFAPRADKARNSGLLYHSSGPHGAFWTYWMRSAEFEIMSGRTGDLCSVDGVRGTVQAVRDFDMPFPWLRHLEGAPARDFGGLVFRVSANVDAERPHGEWNLLEIYTFGDRAIHRVNGRTVMDVDGLSQSLEGNEVALRSGKLQLQSEGAEIFFRRIELEPIEALPAGLETGDAASHLQGN